MANQTPSKQIYDVLVSKNFDPQLLNNEGMPAQDPSEADVFSFDWVSKEGKDYGTVVIMFGDEHDMTVYFGDNVGKSMEGDDKKEWFDFLYQLRMLAKRNLQSFSIQNLNKLKYNMKSMSTAVKEGLFESWIGTRTHSWNAKATEARLMVKHKKIIGEGDARYRYVESLFIETVEGERFKLPFTKISAGKAMLEHVRQGGKPYDARGIHITEIVNEMSVLSRFYKANKNVITEDEAEQQLIQEVAQYHANLKSQLGKIASKRGYTNYFETWNPEVTTEQDMVIEGIRTLFATESGAHRMERALPALTKIKTQGNAMKEIGIFEGWMACLAEGTWALPDTPEKQQKLIALLSKELPVGADATDVTEQLYDILGDDDLFDQLESLAKEDANADARTIIINRLEQMASNPAVAQVIGKLKIEQKPAEEPQEPVAEEVVDETCDADCEEENIDEEIQRISELSSGTLKNYIKKASSSGDERSVSNLASRAADKLHSGDQDDVEWDDGSDDDHKSYLRSKGIARAVDKLEEVSDTVEFDKDGKPVAWSHEGDWEKIKKRAGKAVDPRGEVTNMAGRELQKAKQLDELDKATLGSYVKKASSDRAMRTFDQGYDTGDDIVFDRENDRKQAKRGKGIIKAVNRLVKEDDEDVSPVESAILNRIMNSHIDIVQKYGPQAVMNAARDEAEFVGDIDEIGSSDVSAWVKNVIWGLEKSAAYLKSKKEVDERREYPHPHTVKHDERVAPKYFGEDADDMTDMTAWMEKFDDQEDRNYHMENAVDVAELVGTPDDKKLMQAMMHRYEMRGHLSEPDSKLRNEVMKRLWPLVQRKEFDWNNRVNSSKIADEGFLGQVAGTLAGGALGGPVGAAIGGAAGNALTGDGVVEGEKGKKIGGKIGAVVGGAAGELAGKKGVAAGAYLGNRAGQWAGDKIEDKFFGKKETNEGTALQGQYGHAGKMAPVKAEQFGDKFAEDIARLKALALIK